MSNMHSFRNNKRMIREISLIISLSFVRQSLENPIFSTKFDIAYIFSIHNIVKYYWRNNPSHHEIERQWDLCREEREKKKMFDLLSYTDYPA